MIKMKIGLLPLYIELYDKVCPPAVRRTIEKFYGDIAGAFERKGLAVARAPVCRLKPEFASAVGKFEREEVDAIVTLHLAYSPSLESAEILARTRLPIVVLDTTPDFAFGPSQSPPKLMFNHGIHGVQDMCNLLIRNGKAFSIEAGHWTKSDVLDRVIKSGKHPSAVRCRQAMQAINRRAAWKKDVQAAHMASAFRHSRVGRLGRPFAGMGDFSVPPDILRRQGIETVTGDTRQLGRWCRDIPSRAIREEISLDLKRFKVAKGIEKAHERSVRIGLAVRRWIEQEKLTAFTVNFMDVTRASGLPTIPFLEAALGMERGIGYAGEGDVLTAALVGALASVFPDTTFTEMFCPDWMGGTIFLSHMGEVNAALLAGKPILMEYPFIFGDLSNPVKIAGCLRGGKAVFVNLAPMPGNRFRLILAPVTIKKVQGRDRFTDAIRGWMKPALPVADFLAEYSRQGGTHHAALVYGGDMKVLAAFGRFMGWEVMIIE